MTEETPILIDSRAYRYIRQTAVRNVQDALVELITNSVDAYNKNHTAHKAIEIEVLDQGRKIVCRDFALGLTGTEMQECFLKVGSFTSYKGARGYFSRGAKDISALGGVTFSTIKDGLYSQCHISADANGSMIHSDEPATDDHRDGLKIVGNGLMVAIDLLNFHYIHDLQELFELVRTHGALRDILSDDLVHVTLQSFDRAGTPLTEQMPIHYDFPEDSSLLLDIRYEVPKYPEAEAHFELWKCKNPLPEPVDEKQLEFGFMVMSDSSVYEISTLRDKFRNDVNMPYIYGRLHCNYIADLMYDLDTHGSSNENPFPILDPSRAGINVDHPFVRELYSIPAARLELLLKELSTVQGVPNIDTGDVSDLLRNLEMVGNEIIATEDFSSIWKDNTTGDLIRAIESQRGNYVKVEVNNVAPVLHSEFSNYVPSTGVDEIQSIRRKSSLEGEDVKLIVESRGDISDIHSESRSWEQPLNKSVVSDTDFKVKAKKTTLNLSINLSVNDSMTYRYQIYQSGETIFLNINLRDPVVASEIQVNAETGEVIGITSPQSVMLLGEMFIEAMGRLLLEHQASNNARMFQNLNSYQTVVKLMRDFERNVNRIEVAIHHVVGKYIEGRFGV